VISHEWGKGRKVFTTNGTYLWSFVTHYAAPDILSIGIGGF
jgi:hypothetical protein